MIYFSCWDRSAEKTRVFWVALLVLVAQAALVRDAVAVPAGERTRAASKQEAELPPGGELSTSIDAGSSVRNVPDLFGGIDVLGDKQSPITGSVSRVDQEYWQLKVFNNSKSETFAINVGVVQREEGGAVVKTDYFSYHLKPGASEQQQVQAGPGASEASLILRNYRKSSAISATPTPTAQP